MFFASCVCVLHDENKLLEFAYENSVHCDMLCLRACGWMWRRRHKPVGQRDHHRRRRSRRLDIDGDGCVYGYGCINCYRRVDTLRRRHLSGLCAAAGSVMHGNRPLWMWALRVP